MSEDDYQRRLDREAAHLAHGLHHRWTANLYDSVIKMGTEAPRLAALINGGAAAAGLAFAAAIYDQHHDRATALLSAVLVFAIGATIAGIGSGFGYLAKYQYSKSANKAILLWEFPYVDHSPGEASQRKAMVLHALAVVLVLGSYLIFLYGIWVAKSGL